MANRLLECERLAWPVGSLLTIVASLICMVVALGTPGWIQLDVFLDDQPSGTITFGLIQGIDDFRGNVIIIDETYVIFTKYSGILSLVPVYLTIIFILISLVLCIATICFAFVNTFQVVEDWWRGPATVYILSLLISTCGAVGLAIFIDFFRYEVGTGSAIVKQPHPEIDLDRYTSTARLHYSAYIFIVGAFLPLLSVLLSWRLTVLLPDFFNEDILDDQFVNEQQLQEEDEEEEEEEEEIVHQEASFNAYTSSAPPKETSAPTNTVLY